ncbi:TPD1 protein homolog 1 [Beta vulgaris subsp. vulgaris]|uniref:TPD1 protein homolog 1 n=1 Tax=Beta vulgaris subsp. vulgaris TaxID=3555 RepID=UPI002036B3A3|nr:TPD1 protein homolog 1 [Beta vulgaris subsp. vulgaris]
MRTTGGKLCHLQICMLYSFLFTILFLLSTSGGLGSSSRMSLVKERKSSKEINTSKVVVISNNDSVNATNSTFLMRKLHLPLPTPSDDDGSEYNGMGSSCSNEDIDIYQGPTPPLPSGIPTYTVEILNACVDGCSIANIHVSCGWFSSARLIDPTVFRRLSYDDCLVNDGDPLDAGQSLSFQYANSFRYPLSVSSVDCY